MNAPFAESWSVGTRWVVALAALAVFGVAWFVMARLGRTMRANGGNGIVAFEKAPDAAAATAIREAWGPDGRRAAFRSLVVDFAFIPAYVAVAVVLAGTSAGVLREHDLPAWATFAAVCAWAYVVAGALDVLENVLLLVVLGAETVPGWAPPAARKAAVTKFFLLKIFVLPALTAVVAAAAT